MDHFHNSTTGDGDDDDGYASVMENFFWRDRKRFKKCRDLQRAKTAISSEQKETVKDFSCSQTQTKC